MGLSPYMASFTTRGGHDDLSNPVSRTIDDSVDEVESLPFRYRHKLVEVELPL
jgi:hypothetical protein